MKFGISAKTVRDSQNLSELTLDFLSNELDEFFDFSDPWVWLEQDVMDARACIARNDAAGAVQAALAAGARWMAIKAKLPFSRSRGKSPGAITKCVREAYRDAPHSKQYSVICDGIHRFEKQSKKKLQKAERSKWENYLEKNFRRIIAGHTKA